MSILIKGIKMPNCYNCTLESICSRWARHDVEWQKQNRDEGCPLVEIPTPHGRLIDGDKAEVITFTNESGDFADGILYAADWIAAQPTVIPADKDGAE